MFRLMYRFVRSVFDSKYLGNEFLETQVRTYRAAARERPDLDPHALLASCWLSRMRAHGHNVETDQFQILAFTETAQFAQLPFPQNARALGLFFLFKERPDLILRFPQFADEFATLMGPLLATSDLSAK